MRLAQTPSGLEAALIGTNHFTMSRGADDNNTDTNNGIIPPGRSMEGLLLYPDISTQAPNFRSPPCYVPQRSKSSESSGWGGAVGSRLGRRLCIYVKNEPLTSSKSLKSASGLECGCNGVSYTDPKSTNSKVNNKGVHPDTAGATFSSITPTLKRPQGHSYSA